MNLCADAVLNSEMVELKGLFQKTAVFFRGLGNIHPEQSLLGFKSSSDFILTEVML
jgi:hypothetical protein